MIKKWKTEAKKSQVSWNPKNAKNLEFFHFIIFSFVYHFSIVSWKSSDFAKCSSHIPHFLVENAAKHKIHEKVKENDEKW